MLVGFLLAAIFLHAIFQAITHYGNPALESALANSQVTADRDPRLFGAVRSRRQGEVHVVLRRR